MVIHLKIARRDLIIPAEIISTAIAKSAKWRAGTERLFGFEIKNTEAVMRGSAAIVLALTTVALSAPAHALSGPMPGAKLQNLAPSNVEQVVVVRRGGAVARGPRGGVAAVGRTTVVRPPGMRPGVRPGVRPGGWVRPAYRWGPGGAIAAGAAIGFVAAATAVAWAGAPPAPGYCWYYTDPSRTQGFWDVCP